MADSPTPPAPRVRVVDKSMLSNFLHRARLDNQERAQHVEIHFFFADASASKLVQL